MEKMFILVFLSLILLTSFALTEEGNGTNSNNSTGSNISITCTDSDGGKNLLVVGKVAQGDRGQGDWCDYSKGKNKIFEAFCINDTSYSLELMDCPSNAPYCNKGKCTTEKPLCRENDGGNNPLVLGTTYPSRIADHTGNTDYCQITSTNNPIEKCSGHDCSLREFYCTEDSPDESHSNIPCPEGCSNGVCKQKVCTAPGCNGAYKTGEYENGCPIIKCPAQEDDMQTCLNNPSNWYDQQTNKCLPGFSSDIIAKKCYDPDGGINKYVGAHTYGFRSSYADENDKRIRTGGKDSCLLATQSNDEDNLAPTTKLTEHYCDDSGFIQTTYLECPNGCSEKGDACAKGEDIKETITCYFENSNQEQKCYFAGEFNDDDLGKTVCKGVKSCTALFEAEKGEKIIWKSSCGGYQSTFQDGQDEKVIFDCAVGETNNTQIEANAFRNAYWQCYDGRESFEGGESSCKPYGLWKKYASEFCDAKCSSGKEKCGINSFSLSNPCYSDVKQEVIGTASSSSIDCEEYAKECKAGNQNLCDKWAFNCKEKEEKITIDAIICKDSCPLNDKCYPFGYRKSNQFCSDDGMFVKQLISDEKCENSFECSSNVCVSGQCISEGLLEKVLGWFKKLFSKE